MPPKVAKAFEHTPRTTSFVDKILGAFFLVVFVATWISSIASPTIFLVAVLYEYYIIAAFIVIISLAAYTPWEKGEIANSIRSGISRYTPRYFKSMAMAFEGDEGLPKRQDPQTFYAIHPHGAFCMGWSQLFCHDVMQHVRFCFAPALFGSPFFRLFARLTGNPGSASKESMISYMKSGESIALPPGGFEEATLASTRHDRVFIKKRTGFIRLCLKYGIRVRPVYVFGEKGLYWNMQGFFPSRLALNRHGVPAIVFWGSPLLPLLPKMSVDVSIVVGAPIVLPKIDEPTKEDVKKWHDTYIAALTRLFEDHKEAAYGPELAKTAKLEVW